MRPTKNKDKRILILEQADYIGGRIRTENETYKGKQFQYEAGGAPHSEVEFSLMLTYPVYDVTRVVRLAGGRVRANCFGNKFRVTLR